MTFSRHIVFFLYYWLKNNWLWQYRLQCWLNTMFATHHYRPALSFSSDLRHELTYSLLWYADTTQIKCYHSVVLLLVIGSDWGEPQQRRSASFFFGQIPLQGDEHLSTFVRSWIIFAASSCQWRHLLCSALLCVLGNGRWEKFYVCPKMLEKK